MVRLDHRVGSRLGSGSEAAAVIAELKQQWPTAPGLLLHQARFSSDFKEKIALLSQVVSIYPEVASLRVALAHALVTRGLDGWAQAQLPIALELQPEDPEALGTLALVWQLAGEPARSQTLWQEAKRCAQEQGGRRTRLELGRRLEGLIDQVRLGERRSRLPFNLPGGPNPR